MSYIDITEYNRKWIFTHSSMPVSEEDLQAIKPMSQARSAQFWKQNISAMSPDADRFSREDWPSKKGNWVTEADWSVEWESDDEMMPQEVLDHIDWQDDVTVFFCYEKYNIVETKWSVFKRCWKNFLFYDDGPILIGRRRKEALWFNSKGKVSIGKRD
ncbi:DUF2947 domain-containing protein [Vibrio sp. HN007]|uniref:DUF2947 domain-containing protein n=1 Tax=Vibrio iocasae TaxID=3098914 RepID=UPI0035D4DD87